MAQNLSRVKRRINTVASTRKITNAMKLVSSVKARKLTKEFEVCKTFNVELNKTFDLATKDLSFEELANLSSLFIENKNSNKTLYIIVMSNMGLCGNYNGNLYKYFETLYKEGDEVIAIGNKLRGYFARNKDVKINYDYIDILNHFNFTKAKLFSKKLCEIYLNGDYKEIKIIHSTYVNSLVFKSVSTDFLPVKQSLSEESWAYEPIYGGSKAEFIKEFLPMYLANVLYNIMFESLLCEETSRRNSMDNADKNAQELMDNLNLEYNKARQASITQEITEVVNGSLAVNK